MIRRFDLPMAQPFAARAPMLLMSDYFLGRRVAFAARSANSERQRKPPACRAHGRFFETDKIPLRLRPVWRFIRTG